MLLMNAVFDLSHSFLMKFFHLRPLIAISSTFFNMFADLTNLFLPSSFLK